PVRSGGFGGVEGLVGYLKSERIDLLIDATHPYAAAISGNAADAAREMNVRLIALRRPPWLPVAGDRWREVADVDEAERALGKPPRRVFLALGRNEIKTFEAAPQHFYLVRSVDPVVPPLSVPPPRYLTG